MLRTLALLVGALAVHPAGAQPIIRSRPAPQPAGVIGPSPLPITPGGSFSHPGITPVQKHLRPYQLAGTYPGLWGYAPFWPGWYDSAPAVVNNYIPVPIPTPVPVLPPPAPVELRARLTLNVPSGAKVWLAGKEIDAAASPVLLESPVLQSGQSYVFDVKVQWTEDGKTEERARKVTTEAGESKSLTYLAGR